MHTTPFSLTNKTAVITGGGSGIGLAIARRFATHGAAVEILDFSETALAAAVEELRESGHDAHGAVCDVGDAAAVEAAFATVLTRRDRLHILVNNAGIAHVGNALTTTPEDFARVQRVNVMGVLHCTQAALRHMTAHGGGVILNMGSVVAQVAIADRLAYAASKGAVLAMTKGLAKEIGKHGVRVNVIAPGFVITDATKNRPVEWQQSFLKARAISREQRPDDLVGTALYLLSDLAGFVSGQTIVVDGGHIMY